MNEPCYLYAFRLGREIWYVGQTVDPERRRRFHLRCNASQIRTKLPGGAEFVILRRIDSQRAARVERQVIASLKRKGQAKLNSREGTYSRQTVYGTVVQWGGKEFSSIKALRRHQLATGQTLREIDRNGDRNPAAVALGRLGGKVNSQAQQAARARNAKLGGWPKGRKRGPKKGSLVFPTTRTDQAG